MAGYPNITNSKMQQVRRERQFTLELSGRLAFSAFEDHLSADFDLSGVTLIQRDRYESSWAPNGPVESAPLACSASKIIFQQISIFRARR
jgi:hypothetical protein